jgi:hypothetical protein
MLGDHELELRGLFKIVQLVPIQGESGQLFAFYGLDSTGLLWYGELDDRSFF